jgi:hypothetical protein
VDQVAAGLARPVALIGANSSPVGLNLAGTLIAANAAGSAAKTQADAATSGANQANALARYIYDRNTQLSMPWLLTGSAALAELANEMGLQPQQFAGSLGFNPPPTSTTGTHPPGSLTSAQYNTLVNRNLTFGRSNSPLGSGLGPNAVKTIERLSDRPSLTRTGMSSRRTATMTGRRTCANGTSTASTAMRQADTSQFGPGSPGFNSLNENFTGADLQNEPGYQFRLAEGEKALDHSAAARGGALSGAAVKAAQRYGQDYASGEFTNAFNRFNINRDSRFNRFATVAGVGQQQTNQLINSGTAYGNQVGQNTINASNLAGQANAAGILGRASAYNRASIHCSTI